MNAQSVATHMPQEERLTNNIISTEKVTILSIGRGGVGYFLCDKKSLVNSATYVAISVVRDISTQTSTLGN